MTERDEEINRLIARIVELGPSVQELTNVREQLAESERRRVADIQYRDAEIDRLWGRIRELEWMLGERTTFEAHHDLMMEEKNAEILSLIRRLKEYEETPDSAVVERLRLKMAEAERRRYS